MFRSGLSTIMILLTLGAFLAPVFPAAAFAQASADYAIPAMVMSDGGIAAASASYKITGTVGQPSPVGYSTSTGYILYMGYWGEALVGQATAQDFLFLPKVELDVALTDEGKQPLILPTGNDAWVGGQGRQRPCPAPPGPGRISRKCEAPLVGTLFLVFGTVTPRQCTVPTTKD